MRPATLIEVAVAVIRRDDGQTLFARRPSGTTCAGEWEFPGGKIEAGETARDALLREIDEELGVQITQSRPWITLDHAYPHAHVRLHFFIVTNWRGEPRGREGQQLAWQHLDAMTISPLLAANAPVIRALRLPEIYAITHAAAFGETEFLGRLERAVDNGLAMVQLREKTLATDRLRRLAARMKEICEGKAHVLVNSALPESVRREFDGLHLTAPELMRSSARPEFKLVAASCHNAAELRQAARLGLDFVVLSPVFATRSHPGTETLGDEGLAELIDTYPLPVYALGGMSPARLPRVQALGAHGIAMMRAAWDTGKD